MEKSLVYLAVPYSHSDRSVMIDRFERVNKVAARLMLQGIHIFSPISSSHSIAECGLLPRGWDFWRQYDVAVLVCCKKIIVLRLPGWEESIGVTEEIKIATELGLEVEYIDE